jgi:hypothetical protein
MSLNDTPSSEEMAKRILQNQRTILEQNAKIIAFQEAQKVQQENEQVNKRADVPAIVKVFTS